jgi:hypothetical protein
MPPRPGGVEMAAIVSAVVLRLAFNLEIVYRLPVK